MVFAKIAVIAILLEDTSIHSISRDIPGDVEVDRK